jgi:hypothetical protein
MKDGAKPWPKLIIPQYIGLERKRAEIRESYEHETLTQQLTRLPAEFSVGAAMRLDTI